MHFSNASKLHRRILRKKAQNLIKETEVSKNSSQSGSMIDSSNSTQSFVMGKTYIGTEKVIMRDLIRSVTIIFMTNRKSR